MSEPEDALAWQLQILGIPFQREFKFHPKRRWRFDFLLPDKFAVEIDGGSWNGGRHVTGSGFAADIEKANAATLAGYRTLRFTPAMVESGAAVALIEKAIA